MLPTISSFITKTFKIYFSSFKKLIPYFIVLLFLSIVIFFAASSKVLLFFLIPNSYIRFVVHLVGVVFLSFLVFVATIAIIRVIGNVYKETAGLKFWSNLKHSFVLGFKNIWTLVFLGVPTILTYLVFFIGFLGRVPIWLLAMLYLLAIIIGILYFFWLSFVLVSIAFEEMRLWAAVKNSIMTVKGRVWSIFVRLFLPALLVYIVFGMYNSIIRVAIGFNVFYLLALLLLGLLIIPFGLVVPTVLYLDTQRKSPEVSLETESPDFLE